MQRSACDGDASPATCASLGPEAACTPGRVAIVTMGCAKNEVDSDHMARLLVEAGFDIAQDPALADVVIVNTCSFIQAACEESIDAVLDAASLPRVAAHEACLVVAGCLPSRFGEYLERALDEASAFVTCDHEGDIVAVVQNCFDGFCRPDDDTLAASEGSHDIDANACAAAPASDQHGGQADTWDARAPYAYVKISDGCDRFCSYCTIPMIRGRYRSYPFQDIADEVSLRVKEGAGEIVLIAQDSSRWGADLDEPRTLAWLIDELASRFSQTWFRVMYLQPEGVTPQLLDVMASHDNVCNYLDIPLQHVCPSVLRAMNRHGSRAEFEDLIARIRQKLPDVALRTTLMAGFPGESDEDFEELLSFVEDGLFDYVGVFAYSREENTPAFDLPDQIDEDEKVQRAGALRDAADAASAERIAHRVGEQLCVLVEGLDEDGRLYGRAMCQAPDVDGVTYVTSGNIGDKLYVRVCDTFLYDMEGR